MILEELDHRSALVIKVAIHPGPCRAYLDTGRIEAFLEPVVAEGAFVHDAFFREDIPASIRTGLYAIPAADAIVLIDQHDSFRAFKGGADRTDLHTGRFVAVVAHLGDKERLEDILIGNLLGKAVYASVGRFHLHFHIVGDGILLHPGPEVERFLRDVIFKLARLGALSAANAFLQVDADTVPDPFWIFRRVGSEDHCIERFQECGSQNAASHCGSSFYKPSSGLSGMFRSHG